MRYLFVAIYLFVYSLAGYTQDITGTWEEYSETRYTSFTRLCIVKICDTYIGYTYDRDNDGGHCKAGFSGVFNARKKQLNGYGTSFMENTPGHVLATYMLYYKMKNEEEILDGLVYIKNDSAMESERIILNKTIEENEKPEFIRLLKVSNTVDSTDYMRLMAAKPCKTDLPAMPAPTVTRIVNEDEKKPELKTKDTIAVFSPEELILQMQNSRTNEIISDIATSDKELFIQVLDNAIFDGDTISIIHNGKLIAERLLVSGKPFPIKITLSKENPVHKLTLVAHNLGSIPPNTALLIISNGNKEYRLHAFADLNKNAVIIFRYTGE